MPAIDSRPSLEQMIEYAPGEGAVRAAALQREIDLLRPLRLSLGQSRQHFFYVIQHCICSVGGCGVNRRNNQDKPHNVALQ